MAPGVRIYPVPLGLSRLNMCRRCAGRAVRWRLNNGLNNVGIANFGNNNRGALNFGNNNTGILGIGDGGIGG